MMLSIEELESSVVSTSDFNRNSSSYLKKIRKSLRPLFVNRSNKIEAVLLSPETYKDLLDKVERAEKLSIALAVQKGRLSGDEIDEDDERVRSLLS